MSVSHETECLPLNIVAQIEQKRSGLRKNVRHGGRLCSCCLERPPASDTDRYCEICRASYQRNRRSTEKEELKRLRALEQKLSKGKDNGRDEQMSST